MDAIANERLVTVEALAEELSVPESWIYARTAKTSSARDRLPHYKLGKLLRFKLSEVLLWVEERHQAGNLYLSNPKSASI